MVKNGSAASTANTIADFIFFVRPNNTAGKEKKIPTTISPKYYFITRAGQCSLGALYCLNNQLKYRCFPCPKRARCRYIPEKFATTASAEPVIAIIYGTNNFAVKLVLFGSVFSFIGTPPFIAFYELMLIRIISFCFINSKYFLFLFMQ